MKTLKELKDFCEKNNVRFELNPKLSKNEYYNYETKTWERLVVGYYFGMNNISGRNGKSEWQWVWFETHKEEVTDETTFWFSERYSMVNGKSYKGIREEIAALNTIERRMKAA